MTTITAPGWHNADVITTLVFDVNETMLDLRALDPQFERIFGNARVRVEWFSLVLRNALTLTIVDQYEDFGSVAAASLAMVAATHEVELTAEDRTSISSTMMQLPPHADVEPSLHRLRTAGLELTALTNSPPDIANAQLANAGLVDISKMLMVAAHDWDIAGAMSAGMKGAYVTRPGMAANPLFEEPTVLAPDLEAATTAILRLVD